MGDFCLQLIIKKIFFLFIFDLLLLFSITLLKIYSEPQAIVLPHHNAVQNIRQDFLKKISVSRLITRKIILIGPDHFSSNQTQINICNQDWNLSTGLFKFRDLHLNISVNNELLKSDHSMFNPLSDLKSYFPQATIYPILLGQKVSFSSLETLISSLKSTCGYDCLLVASVDFSHYLPATLADAHDYFTLKNLSSFDFDLLSQIEVDSPQSLYILEKYSYQKKATKFTIYAHTNSAYITGSPEVESTSHVFAFYSPGPIKKITSYTTVSTPKNYSRAQNQNTFGDRFFYGVDKFVLDSSTNFVVATINTPTQTIKSFFPVKDDLFLRGEARTSLIKKYFDSLPNDINLTKDYFWGRLIYDTKDHS